MTRVIFTVAFAVLASTSTNAFAHPGHGAAAGADSGYSIWHYLSEPAHAVVMMGIIAVSLMMSAIATRSRKVAASKG